MHTRRSIHEHYPFGRRGEYRNVLFDCTVFLRPHAYHLQAEIARLRDELALARSSASQAPAQSRQLTAAQIAATPLRELEGDQTVPTPRMGTGNRYTSSVSPSAFGNSSVNALS